LRGRGPRLETLKRMARERRSREEFREKLERRVRKSGLIRPRRRSRDEAEFDRIMGGGPDPLGVSPDSQNCAKQC
jgi:hypothetical protein